MRLLAFMRLGYFACLPFDIIATGSGFSVASLLALPLVSLWFIEHLAYPRPLYLPRRFVWPAASLFGIAALTYIWSYDQARTFTSLMGLAQVLAISIILIDSFGRQELPRALSAFTLGATSLGLWLLVAGSVSETGRIGVGVDENLTAFSLAVGFSAAMWLLVSGKYRALALVAAPILVLSILATGSRSGLVAIVVVLVVPVFVAVRKSVAAAAGFGALALASGYMIWELIVSWGTIPDRLRVLLMDGDIDSSGRSEIHAVYWSRFSEWALSGVGYGADISYISTAPGEPFNVHSTVLRLWVECGFLGAAVLMGVLLFALGRIKHSSYLPVLLTPVILFGMTLGGLEQSGIYWVPFIVAWVERTESYHVVRAESPATALAHQSSRPSMPEGPGSPSV